MSFVWGDGNVSFLKNRYEALTKFHLFEGMQYSEDTEEIKSWIPLVMEGRDLLEKVAATRMDMGTVVNFGTLTRCMFKRLSKMEGVTMYFGYEVRKFKQRPDNRWSIRVRHVASREA